MKCISNPLTLTALAVVLCCVLASGCSEERRTIAKIKSAYNDGDFDEAILLCESALRHDIHGAEVPQYYGLALLGKGRDFEAFRRFDDAITIEPNIAPDIASRLLDAGREAFRRGKRQKAAQLLRRAREYDATVDLGRLKFLVAEAYFEDRDFEDAAHLYKDAVASWPDTAVAEAAFFNLAASRLALEDSSGALEALEAQLKRFPRGTLAAEARFKTVTLMYEHAQGEFRRGNYDAVVEEVTQLLERTDNNSLVQRARFLLGEAYERLEEYHDAYDQYRAIIDKDRGASGRIVDRARQKILAFEESGLL